jgi:hypothetical protein
MHSHPASCDSSIHLKLPLLLRRSPLHAQASEEGEWSSTAATAALLLEVVLRHHCGEDAAAGRAHIDVTE